MANPQWMKAIECWRNLPEETEPYFVALQAYDRHDPQPLATIWRRRFAQESP